MKKNAKNYFRRKQEICWRLTLTDFFVKLNEENVEDSSTGWWDCLFLCGCWQAEVDAGLTTYSSMGDRLGRFSLK